MEKFFKVKEHGSTVKTEVLAGITTFMAMAYILMVNANMFSELGVVSYNAIYIATAISAVVGTFLIAFLANLPLGLASGMGLNAFFVYTVCFTFGLSYANALILVLLDGVVFIILTLTGVRKMLFDAIPQCVRMAISAGIGLFIALLGAKNCGLIVANDAKNCLSFGDLASPSVIVAAIGFLILMVIKARNVPGGMILAIVLTTIVGIPFGVTHAPEQIFSLPAGIGKQFLNIDFLGALNFAYIPFLIALFVPDFFSTFGTVLGVGAKAGYLDKDGNLPGIDKCFKVDAISTSLGALFGMPSMTTYLESSAGVEAGGKTGLTVIFTSIFFGISLFLAPLALVIPSAATGPVLIFIGINMLSAMKNIDYSDITEYIPAFLCVTFTIFANNIANGICVALPAYLVMKIATGKIKKIDPVMYVLVAVCLLYFYSIV